jgi:hypothetical protein
MLKTIKLDGRLRARIEEETLLTLRRWGEVKVEVVEEDDPSTSNPPSYPAKIPTPQ